MRKHILHAALLTVTLAISAHAQGGWSRDWSRDWGRDNGRNDNRYRRNADPIAGAMRDLDNIFRRARVDNHEASHFRHALRELDNFRDRAARGRFDRGALDRAIDNMRDLARADQLHPRDRRIIGSRVEELRFLRDRGFDGDRSFRY
jgi:hypothetical protein